MLPDFAQSWSLVVTVVNCLNLKNIPALFSSPRPFGRSEPGATGGTHGFNRQLLMPPNLTHPPRFVKVFLEAEHVG